MGENSLNTLYFHFMAYSFPSFGGSTVHVQSTARARLLSLGDLMVHLCSLPFVTLLVAFSQALFPTCSEGADVKCYSIG